ncbi:hypothetical protein Ndes2526B_g00645 [Nannochloris sp. 'desiccata']|nr:putative Glutaredoxin 3 [Chlorella desiccata (nom. nud.)]
MHRAVALTPRSFLPTNTLSRSLVIRLTRPRFPLSRRVSPPLLTFLAPTTAMATTSSSSSQQQQPSVAVVTTQGCPYCRQAKADLSAAGIPYAEILITDQLDVLNEIKKATGQSTVPQIFVDGGLIGGASDVKTGLENGSLKQLIQASTRPALPTAIQNVVSALGSKEKGAEGSASTAELVLPSAAAKASAGIPIVSSLSRPLNSHYQWPISPARSAITVSAQLRQIILNLYDTHMTPDGKKVNYKAMSRDPAFRLYVDAAAELQKVDLASLSTRREEAMAFWINVYNAMVVHATAAIGPADGGTFGRLRWYDSVSYSIGGFKFNLNDVEHGILRANAPSPANILSLLGASKWAPKTFGANDQRKQFSLTTVDPRIHFALNCGATSCPPIRVYTPERLEAGLAAAAAAFCGSDVVVEQHSMRSIVKLSSIFKWYGKDFGTKTQLFQFLGENVPDEEVKNKLKEVIKAAGGAENVAVEFLPYDWTVNAVE